MEYPIHHVSVRVPWHDGRWAGTVCAEPQLNGACAMLKRISEGKSDQKELAIAGSSFDDLPQDQWPCCVEERVAFMAPFEMQHVKRHALAQKDPNNYGHFQATHQRYPAYSAGLVPFRWMLREQLDNLAERFELEVTSNREPDLGYSTNWVHEVGNQTEILNAFVAHLRENKSLFLVYAKHVPFFEGTGRILIGVGYVKKIGELTEYERGDDGPRGMIWERPVQHSIRPNDQEGFLMPYHEILKLANQEPGLDLERYIAHAPSEHWDAFSFGSEIVSHDGAISALLAMEGALRRIEDDFGIVTGTKRKWLQEELIRLWKVRGPCPGLGAVLTAFGLSRGLFLAHALQQRVGENVDPWPELDSVFRNPDILPTELRLDLKELAPVWNTLLVTRRSLLKLLSRFDLDIEQARGLYEQSSRSKHNWNASDDEILRNPYRIYEVTRHDPLGVQLLTIDRGVFPEDTVRLQHPLEKPSGLDSAVDARRVRAFSIKVLENAAVNGHTLAFAGDIVEGIQNEPVRPVCPVNTDILRSAVEEMVPEVVSVQSGGDFALQLDRYRIIRDLVQKNVEGRLGRKRHEVSTNWTAELVKRFGQPQDHEEALAQEEKASALAELAESGITVLVGPAGTGKTTVLGILCELPDIRRDGILLLAPTGKARVRMQQLAGDADCRAYTIAQFLNQYGRYEVNTGRYHLSDSPKATNVGTVVVDEASMLTEDMLGALLEALSGVKRLILVGDPSQLPPIGAGRPFVDIVARLKPESIGLSFPRVAKGYAELTIERRQIGKDCPDLQLARWFSSAPPSAGEDYIFSVVDDAQSRLRFVGWDTAEDFQRKLLSVLIEELGLDSEKDQHNFNLSLGASPFGGYDYFNAMRNGQTGAVEKVEDWQILSPLRGMPFGVGDINRFVHERFRADFLKLASPHRNRKIPRPLGYERIVYGDKVINLRNHRRGGKRVYPQEGALGYLANGEIGIVVGQWKSKKIKQSPKILKVEFSSQLGYTYDFYGNDFKEEGDPALELAYALTVHKAQGSQFGIVIFVVPEGHPVLSRELLYTALTRQQRKVVVMHQGPRSLLRDLSAPHQSEIARRRTNLLADCRMLDFPQTKGSLFLQEGLIHRTSKGLAVRSKSELLIAEALYSVGISFEYEKPLVLGGQTRYPDFTIENDISGRIIYWEHLGMLDRDSYRLAWEKKLVWYKENGVLPFGQEGSSEAILVVTEDSSKCGLDMALVNKIVTEVCNV